MADYSNDIYVLPRDTKETARLNEQHKYLLRCFPFHIHPAIPISNDTPDLSIADIACGSGIWLAEVAQRYPNAECHGFDISGAQFPKSPGRLHFHVQDAASMEGPAPEHRENFDVVAVRLIHVSLIGEAWNRTVKNILDMLKPGGHVQWIDWDRRKVCLIQYKPLAKKAALEELLSGWQQFLATRDTGKADELGGLLADGGFRNVLSEKYCSDPDMETRDWIMWTLLDSVPGALRRSILHEKDSGWTEERLTKLEKPIQEERAAEEVFLRFNMNCYVAEKPS